MILHDLVVEERALCTNPDLMRYCLFAPVVFFTWAQMADEARNFYERGVEPSKLDDRDKKAVLELLQASFAHEMNGELEAGILPVTPLSKPLENKNTDPRHPPNWARAAFVMSQLRSRMPAPDPGIRERLGISDSLDIATAMLQNFEQWWPQIIHGWAMILKNPPPPKVVVAPAAKAPDADCRDPYRATH
jgi:hypothetical protein